MKSLAKIFIVLFLWLFISASLRAQKTITFQVLTSGIKSLDPNFSSQGMFQLPDKGFICMALMTIDTSVPPTTRFVEATPVIFRIDSLGRLLWARRYLISSYRNNAIFFHGATPLAR